MKRSTTPANQLLDPLQEAFAESAEMMGYLWSRTNMLKDILNVLQAVREWPGVMIASDRCGLYVCLHGVTLGHLRWNGRIDLPFGPDVRERLVAEEMAYFDSERSGGPIFVVVRNDADVDRALWLFRLAFLLADSTARMCT